MVLRGLLATRIYAGRGKPGDPPQCIKEQSDIIFAHILRIRERVGELPQLLNGGDGSHLLRRRVRLEGDGFIQPARRKQGLLKIVTNAQAFSPYEVIADVALQLSKVAQCRPPARLVKVNQPRAPQFADENVAGMHVAVGDRRPRRGRKKGLPVRAAMVVKGKANRVWQDQVRSLFESHVQATVT